MGVGRVGSQNHKACSKYCKLICYSENGKNIQTNKQKQNLVQWIQLHQTEDLG